jgi:hypothetical protein
MDVPVLKPDSRFSLLYPTSAGKLRTVGTTLSRPHRQVLPHTLLKSQFMVMLHFLNAFNLYGTVDNATLNNSLLTDHLRAVTAFQRRFCVKPPFERSTVLRVSQGRDH